MNQIRAQLTVAKPLFRQTEANLKQAKEAHKGKFRHDSFFKKLISAQGRLLQALFYTATPLTNKPTSTGIFLINSRLFSLAIQDV